MQTKYRQHKAEVPFHDIILPSEKPRPRLVINKNELVEDAEFIVIDPKHISGSFQNDNTHSSTPLKSRQNTFCMVQFGLSIIGWLALTLNRLSTQSFATLSCILFFLIFWAFGGFNAIHTEPLNGISLSDVVVEEDKSNGLSFLIIRGELTNYDSQDARIPKLKILIKDDKGQIESPVVLDKSILKSGETALIISKIRFDGGKIPKISILPVSN